MPLVVQVDDLWPSYFLLASQTGQAACHWHTFEVWCIYAHQVAFCLFVHLAVCCKFAHWGVCHQHKSVHWTACHWHINAHWAKCYRHAHWAKCHRHVYRTVCHRHMRQCYRHISVHQTECHQHMSQCHRHIIDALCLNIRYSATISKIKAKNAKITCIFFTWVSHGCQWRWVVNMWHRKKILDITWLPHRYITSKGRKQEEKQEKSTFIVHKRKWH